MVWSNDMPREDYLYLCVCVPTNQGMEAHQFLSNQLRHCLWLSGYQILWSRLLAFPEADS